MRKITKSLSLVLALLMLVSLFTFAPITANAIRSGDFEYEFLEDGTALLTDYFGIDSVLTIPTEIDGHTIGGISYELFDKCRDITSIESDHTGFRSIDGNLYDDLGTRLIKYAPGKADTHFTVPRSVTNIGYRAFYYCYNLTSVTIPNSVYVIENEAFIGCSYLTSITIPDSVRSIGWGAFDNCKSLETVYYSGSESDWHNIDIQYGNDYLKKATIYYNATEPTTEVTMDVEDARNGLQTCLCSYSAIIDEVEYFGFYYENYYEFRQAYNEAMQIAYHDDDATAEELLTARENLENARNNLVKTDQNPYESIPASTESTEPTTEVTENTEPTETTKETEPTETVPQPTETEPIEWEHSEIKTVGEKSATYFAKGYTGDKVCALCGKVIEKGRTIAVKTLKTPKVTIKGTKKSINVTYKKVKDATGFTVTYKLGKKTYNKKFTLSKTELKKSSVTKTFNVKKSGNYKVTVNAFVTSGKKVAYSKPTSAKSVKVK